MLTPVCLPQSAACCLKNGSAVGMKWFHCNNETFAPEIFDAAAVVGLAAAAVVGAGAVVAAPAAGAVVGAAAGAVVGLAAGAAVGAAVCVLLGPQAATSKTTLLLKPRTRKSRRVVTVSPFPIRSLRGKHTLGSPHATGSPAATVTAMACAKYY